MQESEGWQSAHSIGFAGLPEGAPLILGLLMKLAQMFTGLPIETWGTPVIEKITEVFNAIGTFAARLTSMFGNAIDFMTEGLWDPVEAVFDWIESTLLPTGLIGADWAELFEELAGAESPADALSALGDFLRNAIFSTIQSWRLPLLPLSHITNSNPNLIPDGDFATEATMIGYQPTPIGEMVQDFDGAVESYWTPNSRFTLSTDRAYNGTTSLRMGPGAGSAQTTTQNFAVQPGDRIVSRWRVNRTSDYDGTNSNSKFRIGDQDGTLRRVRDYAASSLPTPDIWVDYAEDRWTVPDGMTEAQIRFVIDSNNGYIYLDDVEVYVETPAEWEYDPDDGYDGDGCAVTKADGETHILYSNNIEVDEDDAFDLSARVKWNSLTAVPSSAPLRLRISQYLGNTLVGTGVQIATVPSPSGDSTGTNGWGQVLSGEYVTPAGVDNIVVELWVTADATAGQVKFDKVSCTKKNVFNIDWVGGLQSALNTAADNLQELMNRIWRGIFRTDLPAGVNALFDEIQEGLSNIPPLNILGLTGGTIADTFQKTVDTLWNGFARLVGITGKSITDVANQASDTITTVENSRDLGEWNNAILGIRNNASIFSGVDSTEESNFSMESLMTGSGAEPAYVSATSSSTPMGLWCVPRDAKKGFISWFGKGVTNVTGLYIDIYKFNYGTSTVDLIYSSTNLVAMLTGSLQYLTHYMPEVDRIDVAHGEFYAVGFRVTGTGTHQIAAKLGGLPAHPTNVPAGVGILRPNGTASSFSFANAVSWHSGNAPWFGIGIVEGDTPPAYFAPRTTVYTTAGNNTYHIPTWANYVDVILVGGGGGGAGGDGGLRRHGQGGFGGSWATETLVRGVDFPDIADPTFVVTVGLGGLGGPKESDGFDGNYSRRGAITSGKAALTANGGAKGVGFNTADSGGKSPGNQVYNGITYAGGEGVPSNSGQDGSPGQAPGGGGGGGAGGFYTIAWAGGNGGRGGAWIVARQS